MYIKGDEIRWLARLSGGGLANSMIEIVCNRVIRVYIANKFDSLFDAEFGDYEREKKSI